MKTAQLLIALLATTATLAGCHGTSTPDDAAGTTDEKVAEADLSVSNGSRGGKYFIVTHPDYRKCAYPICGGWFVREVNHRKMECADGTTGAECHATFVDLGLISLSPDEAAKFQDAFGASHALVRGRLKQKPDEFGNMVDTLVATEAWRGVAGSTATGGFYGVSDSGIVCITYPCPSFHEIKLNTSTAQNIHGVDLAASGADAKAVQAGFDELFATSILAAGTHSPITGPGGVGTQLVASEFYSRVLPGKELSCGGFIGLPCPDGQICDIDVPNACNGADLPGVCRTQPEACADVWDPVCGCNGVTYGNDCERLMAGAQLDHAGACENQQCGTAVCGAGTYCCNASCNMCAPEGVACIQIACQ